MEEQKEVNVEKKKTNIVYIIIGIVLVVLALVGGYLLGKKLADKENKALSNVNSNEKADVESNSNESNNNSNIEVKLTKNELTKLIDKFYFSDIKGNDIIASGLTDEAKLTLAIAQYEEYLDGLSEKEQDKVRKSLDNDKLFKGDKNVINSNSEDKSYELKVGDIELYFAGEDTEYYSYDAINREYKKLFNEEAPKTATDLNTFGYYYTSVIDGYAVMIPGIGSIFTPVPMYSAQEYKVENNQLVVSVYHATYDYKINNNGDKVTITMKNDKSIKYNMGTMVGQGSDKSANSYEKIVNDMIKNHADKMNIYNFIFDIDGSNYYLKEIKKVK